VSARSSELLFSSSFDFDLAALQQPTTIQLHIPSQYIIYDHFQQLRLSLSLPYLSQSNRNRHDRTSPVDLKLKLTPRLSFLPSPPFLLLDPSLLPQLFLWTLLTVLSPSSPSSSPLPQSALDEVGRRRGKGKSSANLRFLPSFLPFSPLPTRLESAFRLQRIGPLESLPPVRFGERRYHR